MKLWADKSSINSEVESFTVGDDFLLDLKLVKYDCIASIAHVKMLVKKGFLTPDESKLLIKELNVVIDLNHKGGFVIDLEDEDCHTAIEKFLISKCGDVGKKIHFARSRNDQVLTALRLYYKDELKIIVELLDQLINSFSDFKKKYGSISYPGYTHMRKAMPSSMGLWVDSFIESADDNKKLLLSVSDLINQCPLGSGAGYGLPLDIDRSMTADLLGFKKVQNNPIYVQNSRGKFESSILHVLSQIMFDLNKISSDIILFSMSEFGFFELSSNIITGSSIMPQKKNPDVLELIRAKYHCVVSAEFEVKILISNLISSYNRDLQLLKKPVFTSFDVVKNCLYTLIIVFENLSVNSKKKKKGLSDEVYAVEKAYNIAKKGISFRDAYFKMSNQYK